MAGITEMVSWTNEIYRIEENDPVEGGESGVDNKPHKDLANRTKWLKQEIENEAVARANTDMALAISIAAEATNRANADNNLQEQINNLTLSILNKAWPLGSVYENAVDGRNPAHEDLLGFGTWIPYAEGRTTIGVLDGDDDFGVIEDVGGAKGHTLSTNNLPEFNLKLKYYTTDVDSGSDSNQNIDIPLNYSSSPPAGAIGGGATGFINTSSIGQTTPDPIPTLMPYVVSAKWRRTA